MNARDDLPKLVAEYFRDVAEISALKGATLFLCRADGVVLYGEDEADSRVESAHVGALLSGVWQAASALASFMPEEKDKSVYRLSFDTSSRGVYIVPVEFKKETLYLGLTYFDQLNPGMLKSRIRNLATRLEHYLKENFVSREKIESPTDYLFSDITDGEMDNLFPFT